TVDNILEATDSVAKSPAGGLLKVLAVTVVPPARAGAEPAGRTEGGQVKVKVQLAPPPRSDGSTNAITIVNGRVMGEVEESVGAPAANFVLLDDKGQPFELVNGNTPRKVVLGR